MKATNIMWDTDGQDVDLPSEMEIPENVFGMAEDIGDVLDMVEDYLTDETGFCHEGFSLELNDEEKEFFGDVSFLAEEAKPCRENKEKEIGE